MTPEHDNADGGTFLVVDGLCKAFGGLTVAENISFSLDRGEALGIIGPNGAGKSTLFNIITGNLVQDRGKINFSGQDISALSPMRRCVLGMGRSFQIPQPFDNLTVFENLMVAATFGQEKAENDVIEFCADTLEQTGLLPVANELSGGLSLLERKRLELARALATDPNLLMLDEIAGGLTDGECGELIVTIKTILNRGVSILWIEHVLHALTAVVERLLVLDFGKVIGIGEPKAIMASKAVQDVYFGIEV